MAQFAGGAFCTDCSSGFSAATTTAIMAVIIVVPTILVTQTLLEIWRKRLIAD